MTGIAAEREQTSYCVRQESGEAQWCERGSHLDPTFSRAELQGSPIGLANPREDGCSLAVICQRTEEGSPDWILKYRSGEVIAYNSQRHSRRVPYMNIRHTECGM